MCVYALREAGGCALARGASRGSTRHLRARVDPRASDAPHPTPAARVHDVAAPGAPGARPRLVARPSVVPEYF